MQIDILYFDGCPNHAPTVARVQQVLADLALQAEVQHIAVASNEDAIQQCFLGSPTVRVNGVDIDPGAHDWTEYSLSCRIYPGMAGLPPDDMIRAALQAPHPPA